MLKGMTNEEALEIITNAIQAHEVTNDIDMALAIAQMAIEKQIAKKPKKGDSKGFYICPCCNKIVRKNEQSHGNLNIRNCKWCGQAWDWSDTK